ncbi:MAG: methyltransferase domain-containing protein, partial [Candidatus Hodarchaeota archaeon]
ISPLKLNLGCGNEKKEDWVNIDIDRRVKPDLIADAKNLYMFYDETIDEIICYHLFEHFIYSEAIKALSEWYRILKPGGKLSIELPDLDRCVEILSKKNAPFDWYDNAQNPPEKFALGGIYGWLPEINPKTSNKVNLLHIHKYGWTYKTIKYELEKVGFRKIKRVSIIQNYRPSTIYNRDMRIECIK